MKNQLRLILLLTATLWWPMACGQNFMNPTEPTPSGSPTPTPTATVSYSYLGQFGTPGPGNSQFNTPFAIAVDSLNNLYVTDVGNNRVEKFTSGGDYASQIPVVNGTLGVGVNPTTGLVYTAGESGYVYQYNANGKSQGVYGVGNRGDVLFGVAVDAGGYMYAADYTAGFGAVQLSPGGPQNINYGLVYNYATGGTLCGGGVALDSSGAHLYVTNQYENNILEFTMAGAYVTRWGSPGSGNGQFNIAYGITVDKRGNVFVADTGNDRVEKFDGNGNYLTQFGSSGGGNGEFSTPYGVAVNAWGKVYVTDSGNNRVQVFSPS